VFYFGHGKSYKKNMSTSNRFTSNHLTYYNSSSGSASKQTGEEDNLQDLIDIDRILTTVATTSPGLMRVGVFYRQNELKYQKSTTSE
jgi:hypothetical protein